LLLDSIGNGLSVSMPLPPFSAKKIAGQKRYDMARAGNAEIVYQDMIFHSIDIISMDYPLLKI
jgi:tRNA U55 pseudouridine synthase TruB